jgi:hypothetical protein
MNTGYHKFYFLHQCTYLYIVYEICQLQYWVLSFKAQKAFMIYIECSFKCILKVGVEVLNAPLVNLQRKTQNNAKSEVRFKQLICNPWCGINLKINWQSKKITFRCTKCRLYES